MSKKKTRYFEECGLSVGASNQHVLKYLLWCFAEEIVTLYLKGVFVRHIYNHDTTPVINMNEILWMLMKIMMPFKNLYQLQ